MARRAYGPACLTWPARRCRLPATPTQPRSRSRDGRSRTRPTGKPVLLWCFLLCVPPSSRRTACLKEALCLPTDWAPLVHTCLHSPCPPAGGLAWAPLCVRRLPQPASRQLTWRPSAWVRPIAAARHCATQELALLACLLDWQAAAVAKSARRCATREFVLLACLPACHRHAAAIAKSALCPLCCQRDPSLTSTCVQTPHAAPWSLWMPPARRCGPPCCGWTCARRPRCTRTAVQASRGHVCGCLLRSQQARRLPVLTMATSPVRAPLPAGGQGGGLRRRGPGRQLSWRWARVCRVDGAQGALD